MLEDKTILKLLKEDNPEAVRFLFEAYYDDMLRSAMRMIYSKEVAEEIVDDVFVNIWNKRKELIITKSFKDYLFASVRFGILNYLRDHKKHVFDDSVKSLNIANGHTPVSILYENELNKTLEIAIDKLPEKCRNIFLLSRNSGLSHKQIARELNISEKTVENQVGIALKKIREMIAGYL